MKLLQLNALRSFGVLIFIGETEGNRQDVLVSQNYERIVARGHVRKARIEGGWATKANGRERGSVRAHSFFVVTVLTPATT
jgi:hypothetical protein